MTSKVTGTEGTQANANAGAENLAYAYEILFNFHEAKFSDSLRQKRNHFVPILDESSPTTTITTTIIAATTIIIIINTTTTTTTTTTNTITTTTTTTITTTATITTTTATTITTTITITTITKTKERQRSDKEKESFERTKANFKLLEPPPNLPNEFAEIYRQLKESLFKRSDVDGKGR